MKSIVVLCIITFSLCSHGFLRNLASEITVNRATFDKTCTGYTKGISFTLETTAASAPTAVSSATDLDIKLSNANDTKTIGTTCTVAATTNPVITCTTSENADTDGLYHPKLAANHTITAGETITNFTLTETIGLSSKTYVKPTDDQADKAKQINYANEGPYNFTITFASAMATAYLPTVTANSKSLDCAVDKDTDTKVICTVTKEKLPEDATNKTKTVEYPVTITNVCGLDEEPLITLKINNDAGSKGAQSMIALSKIALFIIGLFVF